MVLIEFDPSERSFALARHSDIFGSWWPGTMERLEANLMNAMRGADRIHFNLDQLNMATFRQFAQNPSFTNGNFTNWELNTILRDPSLLQKTTFYGLGGTIVSAPAIP